MISLQKTQKGQGFVELKDIPIPEILDSEVLIKVETCGICGTDLHIYHDQFPYYPPVVLGHEFAGTIYRVGADVEDWKEGDRVVGEPHTQACGKCRLCRTGNPQICLDKRSPGWGINGAFARYLRWPDPELLHKIPEDLSFEAAALVEPMANVVSDVVLTNAVKSGDIVVVGGPGPIGIMCALVAKNIGASKVIMLGTDADEKIRMSLCRDLREIDVVLNVQSPEFKNRMSDMLGEKAIDVWIEASGAVSAINMAVERTRKMGTIVAIGLTGKQKIEFPFDDCMKKALDFRFNISTKYDSWNRAIDLLVRNVVPTEKLITHRANLSNWQSIFSDLEARNGLKGIFILND